MDKSPRLRTQKSGQPPSDLRAIGLRKASGIALEIVCIDSLEFIGADLPYPHIVVHHQSNQVRAVDQNDLDADGVREIHRILGVRGCRDEHALARTLALQRTGGVDLAANALIAAVGGAGPRLVLASLFAITAILGLFISNTATAVLMAPVALAIAKDLGASPYPFAMTVALAASAAFMTPVSSPVNTLVLAPGNYGFADFVRIGVPFTLVVLLVTVLLVPWLLPF